MLTAVSSEYHQSMLGDSNPALSAIVLCGGRSERMGTDKAAIELHPGKTLLQLTCESIRPITNNIVVVGSPAQALPVLPTNVIVVTDSAPFPGPLPALLTGFRRLENGLPDRASKSLVWVTGCDTPLITPHIIQELQQQLILSSADAITLTEGGRRNPLLAIYRLRIASALQQAIESGVRRATEFLNSLNVLQQPCDKLNSVEPGTNPTANLNTPEDLESVRRRMSE